MGRGGEEREGGGEGGEGEGREGTGGRRKYHSGCTDGALSALREDLKWETLLQVRPC